jgi:hypothetical protein
MQIVIRYECSACGWRWSRDVSAKNSQANLIPQPSPVIRVPRDRGPCECDESDASAPE